MTFFGRMAAGIAAAPLRKPAVVFCLLLVAMMIWGVFVAVLCGGIPVADGLGFMRWVLGATIVPVVVGYFASSTIESGRSAGDGEEER